MHLRHIRGFLQSAIDIDSNIGIDRNHFSAAFFAFSKKHGLPPFYFRLRYAMTAILYDINSIAHPAAMPIVMTAP